MKTQRTSGITVVEALMVIAISCFVGWLLYAISSRDHRPDPMRVELKPAPSTESRFEIKQVAEFHDSLAYGSTRGIYVLTDHATGKEYVGISGVGISELSTTGKTPTEQ